MKKYNVLVFPSDSEIGLEINNSLRWSSHITLFGASSFANNHSKYVYENFISGVPYVDDKDFISELNKAVEKYKIDFIFPAHDAVVLKLAQYEKSFKAKIIGSPLKTCEITRSKKKTYEFFNDLVRVPRMYTREDKLQFPLFLKPEVGNASRGTYTAHSQNDITFHLQNDSSLLVLEYLPGKEYTVDCFTDRHGKLRYVGPRVRSRISGGISVSGQTVKDERFEKMAEIIHNSLKFQGMWFFQVKESKEGELVLMEIAPRVAGTMGLTRNRGVNLPLLSIYDAAGLDITVLPNTYSLQVDRALINRYVLDIQYRTVYVDVDDTLIKEGKVNKWLMLFVFQCINEKKKIVLLSKHKGDLNKLLKTFAMDKLFTEIIHLREDEEKPDYIKDREAIFIDDSFSEREKVAKMHNILTFDLSQLESLIDWRE